MPQITLRFSANAKNIITQPVIESIFTKINQILEMTIPDIDIPSCNSGVIFEEFSFMNGGNPKVAKCYYELLWLENADRVLLKKQLASKIMSLLELELVPHLERQGLTCVPRIRISDLGMLDRDYFISKHTYPYQQNMPQNEMQQKAKL